MSLKLRSTIVLVFTLLLAPSIAAQSSYVTDDFEVMLRTGPGMDNKIIKALPSGTALSIVIRDSGRGHSQVRMDDGTVGFVLTRFLSDQPAAKYRVQSLEKQLAELRENPAGLQAKLLALQESYDKLSINFRKTVDARDNASASLKKIREASSDVVNISEKNAKLEQEVGQLILQMDDLRIQNEAMKDNSAKKWFALGAGAIVFGLFLGYILSRLKTRRRSSW